MNETRRRILRTAGLAVTVGLAGCGGDGGDGATPAETPTDTPAETPAGTPASTPGKSPTETDAPTATETATPTETETGTPTPTETEAATPTQTPVPSVTFTIDNVGFSAWEVTSTEDEAVAPTGTENPTLTVEVGTRYTVENRGWDVHPFALRAADDTPLLSQSAAGSYEDDSGVNWVDDGDSLAFTATDGLAADLAYYVCTAHSGMRSDVEVR